jgi:hypothetical protein
MSRKQRKPLATTSSRSPGLARQRRHLLAALECYVAEYLPKVEPDAPFDPS